MPSPIVAVLVAAIAIGAGWLVWRHRRAERPYAAALRALAKADGPQPLVPVVTGTLPRHGARAEHLRKVRMASTAVIGLFVVAVLLVPGHRLWTAALALAVILRMVYELLVEIRVTRRSL